ncbi:MAG: FAD-dependent oxidoreductase [Prochloraceae cyanobacterium]
MYADRDVIVVGTGLAGLFSAYKLASNGTRVTLLSTRRIGNSATARAVGGFNIVSQTSDSPMLHAEETVKGGRLLANQLPVVQMCRQGPFLLEEFMKLGVEFPRNKTTSNLVVLKGGGSHFVRKVNVSGLALLRALEHQLNKFRENGVVRLLQGYHFLSLLIHEGICRGVYVLPLNGEHIAPIASRAVIMATGGCASLYRHSTSCSEANGAAAGALIRQGVAYGNAEFIQFHPTTTSDKGSQTRLLSEALRSGGARLWGEREGKRWYFMEELSPSFGNLAPRDIISRTMHNLAAQGRCQKFYLDISPVPVELRERLLRMKPTTNSIPVRPSAHFSMGGILVDEKGMSSLPGLFAVGECDHEFHGANRLGGNALLACAYSAWRVAEISIPRYFQSLPFLGSVPEQVCEEGQRAEELLQVSILDAGGNEDLATLVNFLGSIMERYVGIVRDNSELIEAEQHLQVLDRRIYRIRASSVASIQSIVKLRDLYNSLLLAKVITRCALLRNESRGSHFKPLFPETNDKEWLKTTIATYRNTELKVRYDDVERSVFSHLCSANLK